MHGNAQLESGFSINKDILVENLHESSTFAQCQVYDGIVHVGGVRNVEITKSMVRNKYVSFLLQGWLEKKKRRKIKGRRRDSTEMISCPKNQGFESKKGKT